MTVTFDIEVLQRLGIQVGNLASDAPNFFPYLDTLAGLPLPSAGSAAERALSTRPEIIQFSEDAIRMLQRELTTMSTNFANTVAAYKRGEAENISAINQIWNDLGESGARDHTEYPPERLPTGSVPQVEAPTRLLQPPQPSGPPSLLPNKILDLAAAVTGLPGDLKAWFETYAAFAALWEPGSNVTESDWAKAAMGEVIPISTVGDGYEQIAKACFDLSNQFERLSWHIKGSWTGDSAALAWHYAHTLLVWLRTDIAHQFDFVGGRYKFAADALYRNAARAAGSKSRAIRASSRDWSRTWRGNS